MTVSLLRIISALAGLAAGIGVVGAVFEVVSGSGLGPAVFEVASGSDPGPGLFPMTLLIMNGLIALVACLSLQAVVLAIVDTERNTRETNRLLREWKDGDTEG